MNQDRPASRFQPGDRVEIIGGNPGVWRVHSRIYTPPPRWEPQGDTHISYHLIHHCGSYARIVNEQDLRLA